MISKYGKQKPAVYFANYADALECQAAWVKQNNLMSPVRYVNYDDMPKFKIIPTFGECFRSWEEAHVARYSPSSSALAAYSNAYKKCDKLLDRRVDTITWADLQGLIDDMHEQGLSYSSKKKVKNVCSMVLDYAVAMQYIGHNYANMVDIGKNMKPNPHKPFTEEEISELWMHKEEHGVDIILMLIYTGMRVNELLNMKKHNVDIHNKFLHVVKSKTAAGIRFIPIHRRIFPFVLSRMDKSSAYLIEQYDGKPYSYSGFTRLWRLALDKYGMGFHKTHDCRHTMASRLDTAGANETARRLILGHAQQTVTDGYTHKGIEELRMNIELLK